MAPLAPSSDPGDDHEQPGHEGLTSLSRSEADTEEGGPRAALEEDDGEDDADREADSRLDDEVRGLHQRTPGQLVRFFVKRRNQKEG